MKYLIVFLTLLISSILQSKERTANIPHYDLNLNYDPISRKINVSGVLTLPANYAIDNQLDIISLYFYKQLVIDSLVINGLFVDDYDTYSGDKYHMPHSSKFEIPISKEISSKIIRIEFSLSGAMGNLPPKSANVVSENWSELGLYYPWFPVNTEVIKHFTFSLNVAKVLGYEIFGLGTIKQLRDRIQISSSTPANDIIVCYSKKISHFMQKSNSTMLDIYYLTLNETIVEKIAGDILNIDKEYKRWFKISDKTKLTLLESLRQDGGGYGRLTGIVLSNLSGDDYQKFNNSYIKYFAHELAHIYWYKADSNSWEDWLNESLAEYCALMFIREFFGENVFSQIIQKKQVKSNNSPAIWNFDRANSNPEIIEIVLYNKGPLILMELESYIGHSNFKNFLEIVHSNNIKTTRDFIDELKKMFGEECAFWFIHNLNK
ncbi:MAG: hypothetical protein A2X19_00110 [Bacteroidetes bacterium GWE2_39_28]|nr:MAG: hypothetical protein A2X19_00110 [Bacteroidetes bacterium GWE2_39_28]OFY14371.1 MAG: hypothetical protein A2X16_05310 [Bacteroidetes bacterium GWF2_39_10]OFZ10292.1 MAG: hypothetical protein A2465_03370 [Bacteroidetes bacterium RIFOXYC2_FULL_39_11]HCT95268.1 hypothetical protein [Rikenellaceae bacterium]